MSTMTVIGAAAPGPSSSSADDNGANPVKDELFARRSTLSNLSQEDAAVGSALEVPQSNAAPLSLAVTQPLTSMRPVAS